MSIYLTLRDPSVFPEPLLFSPGRWMQQGPKRSQMDECYVPFSKGSQGCLGPKYEPFTGIFNFLLIMTSLLIQRAVWPTPGVTSDWLPLSDDLIFHCLRQQRKT